ncbi:MAG: SRPBCC family protein [Chitinophagaceae bacterium]
MAVKLLRREQLLPIAIEEAWDFFSSPMNLNEITPEDMKFKVLSEIPQRVYPGLIILYKISPFAGIRMGWMTEITQVQPMRYFVDEQRSGPYRIWHHEHHFEPHPEGVLMTDILHYDIGKGIFGDIAGALFVHKKVKGIFDYRFKKLEALFPRKA